MQLTKRCMTPILNWHSIAKTSVNKGCIGPYFNIGGLSFLSFRLNNYLAVNKNANCCCGSSLALVGKSLCNWMNSLQNITMTNVDGYAYGTCDATQRCRVWRKYILTLANRSLYVGDLVHRYSLGKGFCIHLTGKRCPWLISSDDRSCSGRTCSAQHVRGLGLICPRLGCSQHDAFGISK